MTDKIPVEIMREAIKICDPSFSGGTRVNDAQHIVDVARALMTRDQRAAEIARAEGKFHLDAAAMHLPIEPSPIIAKDRAHIAQRIAAAILSYDEAQQ